MNLAFFPVDRGINEKWGESAPVRCTDAFDIKIFFSVELPQFFNQSEQMLNRHSYKH